MTTAELQIRPLAYNNIDGVGELGIGFMMLSWAVMGWVQVHTPKDSVWNSQLTFLIYIGVLGAVIHYGSKAIKQRFTYPRTGYVAYCKRDTVWRPAILGGVLSAVLSAGLIVGSRSHWNIARPASLIGLLFAASYIRIARTASWKWVVFGLMILGALIIAALPADLIGSLAGNSWITKVFPAKLVGAFLLSFALYGALLFLSGATTFWLYLRNSREVSE